MYSDILIKETTLFGELERNAPPFQPERTVYKYHKMKKDAVMFTKH